MKKRITIALVMCVFLLGFSANLFAGGEQEGQDGGEQVISMYSGSPGGGWYPIAVAFAEVWKNNISGLSFQHADAGGAGNLIAIENGKADVAVSPSASIGDGVMGNQPFDGPTEKVMGLANLSKEYFTFFTWKSSDIETLSDLDGKRIVPLPKGYTTEVLSRSVLKAVGLTYDDMAKVDHVHLSEAVSLMKDNHTDAMSNAFQHKGDPNLTELAVYKPIRALPITDDIFANIKKNNPGVISDTLPAGSYRGVDEDVPVIGFTLALAISSELSEDLVYQMTKAMVENWGEIKTVTESFSGLEPEDLADPGIGVDFHPGAEKYYQEQGWLD